MIVIYRVTTLYLSIRKPPITGRIVLGQEYQAYSPANCEVEMVRLSFI